MTQPRTVKLSEAIRVEVVWWMVRHVPGFERLYYYFRCPYPIDGKKSARACFEAGYCGCNNARRFEGRTALKQGESPHRNGDGE